MPISPVVWAISIAGIIGVFCLDFVLHVRQPHVPRLRESVTWVCLYVTLAVLFGVGFGLATDWTLAGQFFAGYVTEYSLSLDNVFIFLLIITKFRVPREAEQKVLLVGIAMALIFRFAFILLGAAIIARLSAIFYLFGAFLLYTAVKLVIDSSRPESTEESKDYTNSWSTRLLRRWLPTTPDYVGDRVFSRVDGQRHVTPLLLVMASIGSIDILFAMDSIPAVFGLTKEPYIVFMANAFALMGLRQIYFLIGVLVKRLVYLPQGLAVILAFIGVKLILEALHTNELPFINGGENFHVPEIPISTSLGVIGVTLLIVVISSQWKAARDRKNQQHSPEPVPDHPDKSLPDHSEESVPDHDDSSLIS